ncbi:probable inactive purple acid phosphatase 27 [Cannabis sativa]|uniref:probable inactive purple acid phosphatase 27 n=1 Tax=Cannabis sativa TaxID=3483 RepID=UPI0029CA4673|nr:probable inactive purple acid phosphatase 27 [Cannabis sativa]
MGLIIINKLGNMKRIMLIIMVTLSLLSSVWGHNIVIPYDEQPLSKINILKTQLDFQGTASISAKPLQLYQKGRMEVELEAEWVTVTVKNSKPSNDDWVGVFSPGKFDSSSCPPKGPEDQELESPYICSAPIKFQYANYSSKDYVKTGKASLKFLLINMRSDFSFALFSGGYSAPKLVSVSNLLSVFANPKAPLYPRLALGKSWDEMTVTWTSGYNIDEAVPFVEWGLKGETQLRSPAGTLTYDRNSMCGAPARTVGWHHPGFIHTSFLKDLWPNSQYSYRMGHRLVNGSYVWSKSYSFKSSPYPGQDSLQRVIIMGDMGKAERDGSNEYANTQPGSLNTTDQLIRDLKNYDILFHIGDMAYADGYLSEWDQFIAQVSPISSAVPYMIASGNHERDWPNSGSFWDTTDSGGECGVPAETLYYVPADNRAKFWYSADYGMFKFCVADSEHDWRAGSEQYAWIEKCLASADRRKQPWLIFIAHRVLGYSSNYWYGQEGSFSEPEGRDDLQKLWQKYKVDIAFFGHVHNYERICPIYQNQCVNDEKSHFSGVVNGTIHVVTGGGGKSLAKFSSLSPVWSVYRDYDWGFVKLTAFNHSSLLFEYKKSRDGEVYDSFTVYREYKDVLACVHDSCEPTTLAN